MRGAASILFVPPSESKPAENGRESEASEFETPRDPSVVQGGKLQVRYIPGRLVADLSRKLDSIGELQIDPLPLSQSVGNELKSSIPQYTSIPRKAYGFKQNVVQMVASMAMVVSVLGLIGALLGLCIFVVGVALPFHML